MEIIQERLKREFNLDLIVTPPSVIYKISKTDGTEESIHNPAEWPQQTKISEIKEPWIKASIFSPESYIGSIIQLCTEKRGVQKEINFTGNRVLLEYYLPLNEVIFDFHDRLKSISKGYGSFDYEMHEYKEGNLQKVSILVNGEIVEGLSFITHHDKATSRGRKFVIN